jgi:uncharacterized membrane protein
MSTITTRSGKGSPLTHNEVDANFTNLNTDKYQSGDDVTFGSFTSTGIDDNATSTAITIDSSENVGIGTSPDYRLHVYETSLNGAYSSTTNMEATTRFHSAESTTGAYTAIQLAANNGNSALGWWNIGTVSTSTNYDNHLVFQTRTGASTYAERVRIDSSGNVLVGKTSSLSTNTRFEVATTDTATATSAGAGAAISIQNLSTTNNTYSSIYFTNGGSGVDSAIYGIHEVGNGTDTGRTGSLAFATANLGGGVAERMRINSSGNVGIGTSTVNRKLELSANNNGSKNNYIRITDTDTTATLGNPTGGIEFFSSDTGNGAGVNASMEVVYAGSGGGGEITFNTASNSAAGVLEAMRIDGSGNVSTTNRLRIGTGSIDTRITLNNEGTEQTNSSNYIRGVSGSLIYNSASSVHKWEIAGSEKMRIDSSGNVGIGTASPANSLHIYDSSAGATTTLLNLQNNSAVAGTAVEIRLAPTPYDNDIGSTARWVGIRATNTGTGNGTKLSFLTNTTSSDPVEHMRIDDNGNLLVGKTTTATSTVGGVWSQSGVLQTTTSGAVALYLNRETSDGDILEFRKGNTTMGSIASYSSAVLGINLRVTTNKSGLRGAASSIIPWYEGVDRDNELDVGNASVRWDDIYATNGTIQTSDANEKQDIEALSEAEQRVAVAAKGLLRKFRWKSAVEEKGDEARVHFGIIAQDLQAAFEAEGLDAGDYAMFIHSTWTDEETGEERSRMGVRYSELLAFIIAAI